MGIAIGLAVAGTVALLAPHGSHHDAAGAGASSAQPEPRALSSIQSATTVLETNDSGSIQPCVQGELSARIAARVGYAFHQVNVIGFTNVGATNCTLVGYPRVTAYAADGALLDASMKYTDTGIGYSDIAADKVIDLAPGQSAGLYISKLGNPDDPTVCPPVIGAHLAITVPAGGTPFDEQVTIGLCDGGTVDVSPFSASTTLSP